MMVGQHSTFRELKGLLEAQTRTLEEGLSRIEASQENAGGQAAGSVGGDQHSYPDGAEDGDRAGYASSYGGGVIIDSLHGSHELMIPAGIA